MNPQGLSQLAGPSRARSAEILAKNRQLIAGGMVSMNRHVQPEICFVRAEGAHLWDADGNKYIDYHAAFGPYLLGHNAQPVEDAVARAQATKQSLIGTGTTPWEGEAAELLLRCVPSMERVQFLNTGSEATSLATRLARAYTGRDHIVVMQGGYNGWQDEVACNVMTPLESVGPRTTTGEYPWRPLSAGIPERTQDYVHIIEYNSLEALEWALNTYPVAAVLTEPILQNIGVVKPLPGYLQGIRDLCDRYGSLWIGDEVKTGFRHALGGYHAAVGVKPDLLVFGKAIANGYPVAALGGRQDVMHLFEHESPSKRVMISGTYNGHPIPIAAAIATMSYLIEHEASFYSDQEKRTARLTEGISSLFRDSGKQSVVSQQNSAFCPYFMDHAPTSWHDLAANNDMDFDLKWRRKLVDAGVYALPIPTKQWSVSSAHTVEDINETLEIMRRLQ